MQRTGYLGEDHDRRTWRRNIDGGLHERSRTEGGASIHRSGVRHLRQQSWDEVVSSQ